jgi:hypothetical protein
VNESNNKRTAPQSDVPDAERRRVAKVVHDDRGNASVSWRDAPADLVRPVLEVLGNPGLSVAAQDAAYDPYANRPPQRGARGRGASGRTNLRKLSEHIKRMRELEARKRDERE